MPLGGTGAYTGYGYNKMLSKYLGRGIDHQKFMGKELTSKGKKMARKMLGPKEGGLTSGAMNSAKKFGIKGMALGLAIGVPIELAQGKSLGRAVVGEAARDMMYMAAPEMIGYNIAYSMAKNYPKMKRAKEQERDYIQNFRMVGGDYVDKSTYYKSRSRAMEQIKRSRQNISNNVGKEARRYHR